MVVTAAGKGIRFASTRPKQYVPLLGIPILERTLTALDACVHVDALMVVVNEEDVDEFKTEVAGKSFNKVIGVTAGGPQRALSVRNGLRALAEMGTWDLVGVHDGARPLVLCEDVERAVAVLAADAQVAGAVLASPSTDTIKEVDMAGDIIGTADRDSLWRAQTPQIFRWQELMTAYEQPDEVLVAATDDASLLEMGGARVKVVKGSSDNLKITDRADFRLAERILRERGE